MLVDAPVGRADVGASPLEAGQTLGQIILGCGAVLVGAVDLLGQLHGIGEAGAHIVHGEVVIHEGAVVHPENVHVLAELGDAEGAAESRGSVVDTSQLNGELGILCNLLLGFGQAVDNGLEALVAEGIPQLTEAVGGTRRGGLHPVEGGVVRPQGGVQSVHRTVGFL